MWADKGLPTMRIESYTRISQHDRAVFALERLAHRVTLENFQVAQLGDHTLGRRALRDWMLVPASPPTRG